MGDTEAVRPDLTRAMRDDVDGTLHRPRYPQVSLLEPEALRATCGVMLHQATIGPTQGLVQRAARLCPDCWPEA